jgi:hypothetical protein
MAPTPITGTSGNDKKVGTSANEIFFGLAGNDDFDGGAGTDTAGFNDVFADFTISTVNGVTMVKHRDNKESTWDGNDKYTNVERLQFSDKTIFLKPNQGPTVGDDTANGVEDQAVVIQASTLLANDSDPDGDDLLITGVGGATHGSVKLEGQTITFTPDANYFGAAEFTYTVKDVITGATTEILSATGKVSLAIESVNDAPTGTSTAALEDGTEDTAYTVSAANLLAGFSDVDGDTLSVSGLVADHGKVTNNGNGTYTISPTANYNGTIELAYDVSDGKGGTVAAKQSFALASVNDAPTAGHTIAIALHELADKTGDTFLHQGQGAFKFYDLDLGDTHTASFAPKAGSTGYVGTFAVNNTTDTVGWSFQVADKDLDFLTVGQVLTQEYVVTIDDGQGGRVDQTVTVTLNGAAEPVVLSQKVITFEDLENFAYISNGYHGFSWGVPMRSVAEDNYPGSGYDIVGSPGGVTVGWTPFAYESDPFPIARTDGADFIFDKVYVASAWDDNQNLVFRGFNNGEMVGEHQVTVHDYARTLVDVSWGAIDQLTIHKTNGGQIAFDDFVFLI